MACRIRRLVVDPVAKVKTRRASPVREGLRRELDEALLAYRAARMGWAGTVVAKDGGSWLRTVRQMVGMPVKEVARRLGMAKWEVYRLEKAEREARIVLGSLEELAAAQGAELEKERAEARKESERRAREREKKIHWRKTWWQVMRRALRKKGFRLR